MASTGQLTAASAVSTTSVVTPAHNANPWVSPANALTGPDATSNADTTHAASITAATFDSPDQSELLVLTGFDFSAIPDGSAVTGITVRVTAFFTTGQGSGSVDWVSLVFNGGVDSVNRASTAVPLTGTFTTVNTFGSSSDTWSGAATVGDGTSADIKKSSFGIAIGMLATAANADVFVDVATIEVEYTSAVAGARSMQVTATQAANGAAGISLVVTGYRGAADPADQAGATLALAPSAAPGFDQSLTTLADNSIIAGALTNAGSATDFTWDASTGGSSTVDSAHTKVYGSFVSQAGLAGAYTRGATAPGPTAAASVVLAEIQAAAGGTLANETSLGSASLTAQAVSTQAFTPSPGSLLIAAVSSNAAGALALTVQGGGLNWQPLVQFQPGGVNAYAGIWIAKVATVTDADPLITAVASAPVLLGGMLMRVLVLTGAAITQGSGGTGTQAGAAAHEASLTATQAGSSLYGAAWAATTSAYTADTGTTEIDNVTLSAGGRYGTFRGSLATSGAGSAGPYGFTAPTAGGCAAVAEILAQDTIAGLAEDSSAPPAAASTGTAVSTTAFSPPEWAVLLALVSAFGGSQPVSATVSGMGLSWSELISSHPASGTNGYAGIWWALVPDAVIQIGSPLPARSATSPVTGTWGTGQARTAGHLLVAVVTADAATSAAAVAQNAGTSGWVNQVENGNAATANSRVSIWTKTATGGDAAPAFTSALSGTAAMTCTLFEYTGADVTSPVDTSAVYQSGGTSGSLTSMTATTGTVVSAGAAAISVFTQERAASTNTWSETGTGWSSAYSDGSASSVAHTQVNTFAQVPQGGPLTDSGRFATRTSAFGAGAVLVIRALPAPLSVVPAIAGNPVNAGREAPAILMG